MATASTHEYMNLDLLTQAPEGSPFDSIRQIDQDGNEFWSARDLMPYLGYSKWERLGDAIERTEIAITSGGNVAGQHIRSRQREDKVKVGFGERTVISEDYELTRFGCYILFMNADSRKPEVSAAQSYFAVQTRKAEVAAPEIEMPDDVLLSKALLIANGRLEQLQVEAAAKDEVIAELEPKAEVVDKWFEAKGDYDVAEAAKMLCNQGVATGRNRLFKTIEEDLRWIYRDGRRTPCVYQRAIEAGHLAERPRPSYFDHRLGIEVVQPPQVRVTPKGLYKLWKELH